MNRRDFIVRGAALAASSALAPGELLAQAARGNSCAGPPSGDGTMRGGFLNQSLRTGRAHAVRAVIEGVAFNLRWLRAAVEKFVGRRFDQLNYIGRTATSDIWCQTLADVLERPIRRMAEPGVATSRGAALAGLVAIGRITVDEIPSLVPVERTFLPRADYSQMYADLFAVWLASYKATKPLFRQLQRIAPVPGDASE